MAEEDPKIVARNEVRSNETQKLLRQFMNTDGPKGTTDKYRNSWERIFGDKCVTCDGFGRIGDAVCHVCSGTGKAQTKEDGDGTGQRDT